MGKCTMANPEPQRDTMPDLSREDFKSREDRAPVRVPVPELGGAVYVRIMSGVEQAQWEAEVAESRQKSMDGSVGEEPRRLAALDIGASLVARCVCDKDGERLFGPEDVEWLRAKSFKVLSRLMDVIQRENGLTDEDIEELEKN